MTVHPIRWFDLDQFQLVVVVSEPGTPGQDGSDTGFHGCLRPMGGSVDLPAALQQMINYIDRKGSGDIQMASE